MATIKIGPRERLLSVGQTGSGKTTLLRNLAQAIPYRIILDTKQDPEDKWLGHRVYTLASLAKVWNKGPIVYQPTPEYMTIDALDAFFRFIYETTQDVLTVVDEANMRGILNSQVYSYYADLLLRQGRGRRQPLWNASQRPMWLKNEAISEAEHIFTFRLSLKGDRQKMAGICGDTVLDPPTSPEGGVLRHSAWYTYDGETRFMYPLGKYGGK